MLVTVMQPLEIVPGEMMGIILFTWEHHLIH